MAAWGDTLKESRKGVCLHYDGSQNDRGSVAWLMDERCRVSYNWIILDNGEMVIIAPREARAYHAGHCAFGNPQSPFMEKYVDANSAFYGIAIAATVGDKVTPSQLETLIKHCKLLFWEHEWSTEDELWRIVGHNTEAWDYKHWKATGEDRWDRKVDPIGPDPSNPVLDTAEVRRLVGAEGVPA